RGGGASYPAALRDAVGVVPGAAKAAEVLHARTRLPHEGLAPARGRVADAHDLASRVDAEGLAVQDAKGAEVLHARTRLPEEGVVPARGRKGRGGRVAGAHDLAPRVDAEAEALVVVKAQGAQ